MKTKSKTIRKSGISKGASPWFWSKNSISPPLYFRGKKEEKSVWQMFCIEKRHSRQSKQEIKNSKNWQFSKRVIVYDFNKKNWIFSLFLFLGK